MISVAVELYVQYNMKQHWNIPDFNLMYSLNKQITNVF